MTFGQLSVGQTFDFIGPDRMYNSFFEPCLKTGTRTYIAINNDGKQNMRYGKSPMRVGSLKADVHHVGKYDSWVKQQNPSTIRVRSNPDGTVKVQIKKVKDGWNLYLGGTRVDTFHNRETAEKYGRLLMRDRRIVATARSLRKSGEDTFDEARGRYVKNPMTYGTSHFTTRSAAIRYYKDYGDNAQDVDRKIAEGLIHIGKPVLKAGQRLTLIDGGKRYAISE